MAMGCVFALAAASQRIPLSTAGNATGSVTGTVLASDTQRPVRLAQVQFISTQQSDGRGGFGATNARTDIDGNFTANVAPGDYYVTATATGYISTREKMQVVTAAGGDPDTVLAALPQVHVVAGETSNATVTIDRGGALAGHVSWEDGSPAAGVSVSASPGTTAPPSNSTANSLLRGFGGFGGTPYATTDDRGNFRMSGLAADDYVVLTTLQPSGQFGGFNRGSQYASPVRIYAPGVFRRSAAKALSVRAGEDRTDIQIVLDLRGLHTVSGAAGSVNTGSAVASGRVTLVDPNDSSLQISGSIAPTGEFKLAYVPPGTYTLQVSGGSSQPNVGFRRGESASTSAAVSYQPYTQTLVVGDTDVSGVAVMLTPVKSQ
jgi:hypothetical protein